MATLDYLVLKQIIEDESLIDRCEVACAVSGRDLAMALDADAAIAKRQRKWIRVVMGEGVRDEARRAWKYIVLTNKELTEAQIRGALDDAPGGPTNSIQEFVEVFRDVLIDSMSRE